jgi:plastocyanin
MRTTRWFIAVLAVAAAAIASAADLNVRIADDHGKAVADAVVTVLPEGDTKGERPVMRPAPSTRTIDQKNLMFIPYIEIFRPGDNVVFRNSDQTRHHVYSFSPIKAFEFVLAPGESSPPLVLDKSGVIAVGCNIHDMMITYLYVSDAPWIAHSGADGQVVFHDLPAGAYNVRVWQPRLRPNKPDLAQSTTLVGASESKALTFNLQLLPDSRREFDREHTSY